MAKKKMAGITGVTLAFLAAVGVAIWWFMLRKKTGVIWGTTTEYIVVEETEVPLSGVTVSANGYSTISNCIGDECFRIEVPPGDYAVSFSMEGYDVHFQQPETVTVAASEQVFVRATMIAL